MAMLANNLSTLGVSASQLDNTLDTTSFMLQWLPTTGEFGLYGTFGDYDYHEKVATRLGGALHPQHRGQAEPAGHQRHREQPDPAHRRQHHLHARPLRPGHHGREGDLRDGERRRRLKYKGLSLEAEYYWRWLSDFAGTNTAGIADIDDHGFQVQSSAMVVPEDAPGLPQRLGRSAAATATPRRCGRA